uniref:DUF1080 domain-containing protein n=1 Tax=Schlesneria paludicola TaxID=360056 RepID=A0A7C4LMG9_9PLAN
MLRQCVWCLVGLASILAANTSEAQANKPKAALSPQEADADFPLQGEYVGDLVIDGQNIRHGVQVVAQGNGQFHAVGYPGGLPGDGWQGGDRVEVDGRVENGVLRFEHENIVATVRDGVMTVTSNGTLLGELKKVLRTSPTLGAKPPAGAVVLFDGTTAEHFENGRKTEDGLLMQGVMSKLKFQDATVHLEFLLSYMPTARGQARANSGCYLQGRYEVQILDSFGLAGKHNECGGIYEIRDPDVNMCFPPLSWQTYDIDFTAARYDAAGKKTADARMTVRHNGVVIHKDVPVPRATRASPLGEGPEPGPLYLQDHGDPIRFRNIWIVTRP